MRQGMAAWRATGAEEQWPHYLALLVAAYGKVGQTEQELALLAEALAAVERSGERYYEAELYRLKGELSLQSRQVKASQDKYAVRSQKRRVVSRRPSRLRGSSRQSCCWQNWREMTACCVPV